MTTQDRGIIEMTRRLAWNLLRIEREQVFYFDKPLKNKVKNLLSEDMDIKKTSWIYSTDPSLDYIQQINQIISFCDQLKSN